MIKIILRFLRRWNAPRARLLPLTLLLIATATSFTAQSIASQKSQNKPGS
jgi:hypothetical protein